jgi:META domain
LPAVSVLLAFVVVGCTGAMELAGPHTTWAVIAVGGKRVTTPIVLTFNDEPSLSEPSVNIRTGCRDLMVGFIDDDSGDAVYFDAVAPPPESCSQLPRQEDESFFQALGAATSWNADGNSTILLKGGPTVVMVQFDDTGFTSG